ncbi:UPF0202 protein KRE33 [Symbiodinium microadriaticum]|uniref:RNA cytidine acetyltransferase n=2 Tax=Symbiodinium TaxID=2949 RepID=A0A1Q9E1S9_SYMMI|nr:UPF0202 protein KRE33 [Symbiodinium microadriaticum]
MLRDSGFVGRSQNLNFMVCLGDIFQERSSNIRAPQNGGALQLSSLLRTMDSLKQLYNLAMDAHHNLRTETHIDTEPRFNERLVLSLKDCSSCLVVDDELNILPLSRHAKAVKSLKDEDEEEGDSERPKTANEKELEELKATTAEAVPLGPIVATSRTLDQAKAVMSFVDAISEKSLNRTMALTAARGRGKSAALGLAISAAVAYGYSNIFVTAPSPENLSTVFEFILKGFDALGMKEHQEYELVQAENPELNKALVRVNIFKDHRQTVQYISPSDWQHLAQAELLVVDEAAAIPLPIVKKLLGPYLVLLASTVNGYEGTGRALSLKLIEDLKAGKGVGSAKKGPSSDRTLRELSLEEPIRYAPGDPVESWLGRLLCLDSAQVPKLQMSSLPLPAECSLFWVNRDALFSYHEASEKFLFKMMSLFVSSHYKNSPNDLLLMADAPAHHLLVLLPPIDAASNSAELPEVLVAIQICMEGALSQDSVKASLKRGLRPSGDLIPWTLTQHFLHDGFGQLSGARIVRIATHPALQRKGYASEAVKQMIAWFEQKTRGVASFGEEGSRSKKSKASDASAGKLHEEELAPREVPPLLEATAEVPPPYDLDYVGTSFGLTYELFEFWRRSGFRPVYLRQQPHSATGEHSCILLRTMAPLEGEPRAEPVIDHFVADFRLRFLRLLQGPFSKQPTRLALSVVDPPPADIAREDADGESPIESQQPLTAASLLQFLSRDDIHRLEQYGKNLVEYALVLDIVPTLATLFLSRRMPAVRLSTLQCAILVAVGCQHRSFDEVAQDFNAPASQLLALFNKAMHKLSNHCRSLLERQVEEEGEAEGLSQRPMQSGEVVAGGSFVQDSLKSDQEIAGQKVNKKLQEKRKDLLASLTHERFAVAPSTEDFAEALGGSTPASGIVSVKKKRQAEEAVNAGGRKAGKKPRKFRKRCRRSRGGDHEVKSEEVASTELAEAKHQLKLRGRAEGKQKAVCFLADTVTSTLHN